MRSSLCVVCAALLLEGCQGGQPVSEPPEPVRQFYEARIASNQDRFEAFAGHESLGKLRDPARRAKVPGQVLEAYDFYYQHVLEQDWGNVRVFCVPVEGALT